MTPTTTITIPSTTPDTVEIMRQADGQHRLTIFWLGTSISITSPNAAGLEQFVDGLADELALFSAEGWSDD